MSEDQVSYSQALPPETLLMDRYRITSTLGTGRFTFTYKAINTISETLCVIKEFFPEGSSRSGDRVFPPLSCPKEVYQTLLERFNKETRNFYKLNHKGIVKVIHFFNTNDTSYYAMELIEGHSIGDIMRRYPEQPFELEQSLTWIKQVGAALQYMHEQKMFHCNVKPDNLMINRHNNQVVLIGFGLDWKNDFEGPQQIPPAWTAGYASLELENGKESLRPETDVYSLAATLYHFLTGKIPERASIRAASTLADSTNDPLKPVHQIEVTVPQSLSNAIAEAMQLQPEERTPTIQKFLDVISVSKTTTRPKDSQSERSRSSISSKTVAQFDINAKQEEHSKQKDTQNLEKKVDTSSSDSSSEAAPFSARSGSSADSPSSKKIWLAAAVVLFLVGGFLFWQFGPSLSTSQDLSRLVVQSNIAGATVFINNQSYGATPLKLDLKQGDYQIRVEKSGFHNFQETIVLKDEGMVMRVSLAKVPPKIPLKILAEEAYNKGEQHYFSGDFSKAIEWYQKAEKHGFPNAKRALAKAKEKKKVSDFIAAIEKQNLDRVKKLLATGQNPNDYAEISGPGDYPLQTAISSGNLQLVKLLLDAGADPNLETIRGTVLSQSAYEGKLEIVKALIESGADVHKKSEHSGDPLQEALIGGNPKIVETLIAAGVDVNKNLNIGQTPLQFLVQSESASEEMVKVLLKHGSNACVSQEFYEKLLGDTKGKPAIHQILKNIGCKPPVDSHLSSSSAITPQTTLTNLKTIGSKEGKIMNQESSTKPLSQNTVNNKSIVHEQTLLDEEQEMWDLVKDSQEIDDIKAVLSG